MPRRGDFIRHLASAVDTKGDYFPGHSDGVAYLVTMMAREANYSMQEIRRLALAAYMHDIGKIGVHSSILSKPGKLTHDEWDEMRAHSRYGAWTARKIAGCEFVSPWIMHHHEHYNGSGYPAGLKGEAIPWPSRIIHVADAFHVMTTDRPYKGGRARLQAIAELRALAGEQFCPRAVALFESYNAQVSIAVPALVEVAEHTMATHPERVWDPITTDVDTLPPIEGPDIDFGI